MLMLKKLWNILNHAGKPWQISMAVSLAMIVGFTPTLSVHNIVIFLFVLVLNIHIGMFLLATAFFAGIGYMFDPIFHDIGLMLLSNDSLVSLWTILYNNPFTKITSFNNTILMGSLVVSLILFFPLLKLVNMLLVNYREIIAKKIAHIPLLNKLEYFKAEDIKSVKPLRIVGLILFIGLVGAFGVLKILFLDPILKSNLEHYITKNSEKVVRIGSLETSILSSNITLKSLEINDKNKPTNNISISSVTIDISFGELLMKKLVVENLLLSNISFPNTQSEVKNAEETKSNKTEDVAQSSNDFDIKSLVKVDSKTIENGLNQNIKEKIDTYKEYYNKIKPYLNDKSDDNSTQYERGKGVWIKYKDITSIPKVLIKTAKFNILYKGENYDGTFYDFSTNQTIYNKPFVIKIDGKTNYAKNINSVFSIFETDTTKQNKANIKFDELKVDNYINKNVSFKNTLLSGNLSLNLGSNDNLVGVSKVTVLTTDIIFNETNKYIKMLNKSLEKTNEIEASFDIYGTLDNPKIKLNSNLDTVLSHKVKAVIASEKEQLKQEVKEKANELIKKQEEKITTKAKDKLKSMFGF